MYMHTQLCVCNYVCTFCKRLLNLFHLFALCDIYIHALQKCACKIDKSEPTCKTFCHLFYVSTGSNAP